MNEQNIMFGYPPPMEKSKNVNKLIFMNVLNILFDRPRSA